MKDKDFSILIRAILFGIAFMAIGLLSGLIAAHFLVKILPSLGSEIAVGLGLFVIWLVHGSTLRSIYRLDGNSGFIWLVLGGIVTILGGVASAVLLRQLIEKLGGIEFPILTTADMGQKGLFLFGLAVLLSFFSAINLKVKSRFLGNFLELILIVFMVLLILIFID
ncbi:MAG: hypothetical protein ACI85O_001147 [Saprospiraceae bacterium]|jgi:hypothetical protein